MRRAEARIQVIKFYNENKEKGKAFTVKHFEKIGVSKSCSYNFISEAEHGTTSNTNRVPFGNVTNTTTSQGRVVKKVPTPASTLSAREMENFQIDEFASKGEKQHLVCRQRCGVLLSKYKDHDYVMDNKCTFTYRSNQGSRFRNYYTFDGDTRPAPVIYEEDFFPRLNVWIAFSNKGISDAFIQPVADKFETNSFFYECLKKRLVPFIKSNHGDLNRTVIWSDGETRQTNKQVARFLEHENIKFIDKFDNPGNRVRCFTYFWTLLKNAVYDGNWVATSDQELEARIRHCLKNINMNRVKRIANDASKRILEMYETGDLKQFNDFKQKYTKE